MKSMIDHGALTDLVLATLGAQLGTAKTSPGIGDGVKPNETGWLGGQPGDDIFRPYLVLVSGGATPIGQDLETSTPMFGVTFSLRCFGGSRKQCDWMATQARSALFHVIREVFGDPKGDPTKYWAVMGLTWGSLGALTRVDATDPPFWQVADTFTLNCDGAVF